MRLAHEAFRQEVPFGVKGNVQFPLDRHERFFRHLRNFVFLNREVGGRIGVYAIVKELAISLPADDGASDKVVVHTG